MEDQKVESNAYVKRYAWPLNWELMAVDLMVRYRAEYTIDAERAEHLKALAQSWEPLLMYHPSELYNSCDFYFDKNMYIKDNHANYDSWRNNPDQYVSYDADPRVFIHMEEWTFHDTQPLNERPMIAVEYWYYCVYNDYWS